MTASSRRNPRTAVRPLCRIEEFFWTGFARSHDQSGLVRRPAPLRTFLLARYKFVAKMFSGRQQCRRGRMWGRLWHRGSCCKRCRMSPFTISIRCSSMTFTQRHDARWPLKAEFHDIVALVAAAQARRTCSVWTCIEHIARSDEHAYLSHLCRFAHRQRTAHNWDALAGIAALCFASQQGAGHINCKTQRRAQGAAGEIFYPRFHVFHER